MLELELLHWIVFSGIVVTAMLMLGSVFNAVQKSERRTIGAYLCFTYLFLLVPLGVTGGTLAKHPIVYLVYVYGLLTLPASIFEMDLLFRESKIAKPFGLLLPVINVLLVYSISRIFKR